VIWPAASAEVRCLYRLEGERQRREGDLELQVYEPAYLLFSLPALGHLLVPGRPTGDLEATSLCLGL